MEFDSLINRHKDAVYRQLYRMCGNHEDAEDVLIESMVKAHRALDSLEHEEAFRSWLAQIARRTCGRLKMRERMVPVLALEAIEGTSAEPVSAESDLAEKMLEAQLKDCILRAYSTLPQSYGDVYQARDIDGLTAEETAKRVGISVAAVKSRLHRARAMIRERIDCAFMEP